MNVLFGSTIPACRCQSQLFTIMFFLIFFFLWRYSPNLGLGLSPWNSPFHFGLLDLRHSVGLLGRVTSSSQGLYLYKNTEKRTHAQAQTQTLNVHALSEIWTYEPGFRDSENSTCLKVRPHYSRSCWCSPGLCSSGDSSGFYLCS
jgi:hypothetical protein